MKKWKLLIIDAVIVLVAILFFTRFDYSFSPLKFGKFLITVLFVIACGVVHYLVHSYVPKNNADFETQASNIIKSEDSRFDTYMYELEKIKKGNPEFVEAINYFKYQIHSFSTKEDALMKLIDLNNDNSKDFLMDRNKEVQLFLIENLKKFVKRLIVYKAKTKKNRSGSIEDDTSITEIFAKNDELIDLYDKLLDEVSRMGDNFNTQDPALQSVIANLQSIRAANEVETEDEEEIQLFVSTGMQ